MYKQKQQPDMDHVIEDDWQHSSMEDLKALAVLPKLDIDYLPWTGISLRPAAIRTLLNEIVLRRRFTVLEFGSGISTLYMAKVLSSYGGKLVTIEHDPFWFKVTEEFCHRAGVSNETLQIVQAPLIASPFSIGGIHWYDHECLEPMVKHLRFDMMVVDGPLNFEKDRALSRYPALPVFYPLMNENFVVYLDDTGRIGEQTVAERWQSKFNLQRYCDPAEGGLTGLLSPGQPEVNVF